MKKVLKSTSEIYGMANILGNRVIRYPNGLPFSFYLSSNLVQGHTIRAKVVFDPSKISKGTLGNLTLSEGYDNWKFTSGKTDKHISDKDIQDMKRFFKTYLILFCMLWDEQVADMDVVDYFTKPDMTLEKLIHSSYLYQEHPEYQNELNAAHSVVKLEQLCRRHDWVNMYGN